MKAPALKCLSLFSFPTIEAKGGIRLVKAGCPINGNGSKCPNVGTEPKDLMSSLLFQPHGSILSKPLHPHFDSQGDSKQSSEPCRQAQSEIPSAQATAAKNLYSRPSRSIRNEVQSRVPSRTKAIY